MSLRRGGPVAGLDAAAPGAGGTDGIGYRLPYAGGVGGRNGSPEPPVIPPGGRRGRAEQSAVRADQAKPVPNVAPAPPVTRKSVPTGG